MLVKRFRGNCWVAVASWAIAVGFAAPSPTMAQVAGPRGDDVLDQARRAQAVAAQKTESQVRNALLEAQRLAPRDTPRALERLRDTLVLIEGDSVLTESRRETLKRVVKDRIRVTEAERERSVRDDVEKNESRALTDTRRDGDDRQTKDQAVISRTLATIRELRTAGKIEEANRLANELASQYPTHMAVQSGQRTMSVLEQFAAVRQLRADRERRTIAANLDIQRSATPPSGDVEFPKDWAERTKNRTKSLNPFSAKEKVILRLLNSPITIHFKESRFEDVIDYLQTVLHQPILLDRTALEEAHITYDSPVTVNVKGVAVRTLLRKVLADFGLTYIIKDEAIQVVSATRAKDMMVTRSYYLGDIIAGQDGAFFFGPAFNQVQTLQNAARIVEMIQSSADPQSWQVNGGLGTITFNPATLSLVIKQSAEVHGMLSSSLMP